MSNKEELKKKMAEASNKIINTLEEYDFTTVQASLLLSKVSKAIRQAQGEVSGKEMIEDEK